MPSLAIRHSLSRAVGVALTVALAACGGGGLTLDALTTNTGGDTAPTAAPATPATPATYTIGGTVSGLTGSGLVLQINGGDDLAISANSNFVFATPIANGASYAVTVKSQPRVPAQNCSVTAGSGTAAANMTGVAVICVAPTPRFAYVANFDSNNVSAYSVDPKTGALTAIAKFPAGAKPSSVAVDPSGKFAFVVNQDDKTVSAYTINSNTGALTPVEGPPVNTGGQPGALEVDPSGKFVFVPNFGDHTVSAYTIHPATGALAAVAGSPFATGPDTGPWSVTVDPSGKFAYVANFLTNNVSAYTVDAASGALSAIVNPPLAAATLSLSRRNKGRPLQFYARL